MMKSSLASPLVSLVAAAALIVIAPAVSAQDISRDRAPTAEKKSEAKKTTKRRTNKTAAPERKTQKRATPKSGTETPKRQKPTPVEKTTAAPGEKAEVAGTDGGARRFATPPPPAGPPPAGPPPAGPPPAGPPPAGPAAGSMSPAEERLEMATPEKERPSEQMKGAPESLEQDNQRVEPHRASGVRRARLGAVVEPVTLSTALRAIGRTTGLLVKELVEGTPAQRDGMLAGDVITAVEGRRIARPVDVLRALAGRERGKVVNVEVVRDDRPLLLRLKLDQGTTVVHPQAKSRLVRERWERRHQRRRIHRARRKMDMRRWRQDLLRRHRMQRQQLYRRGY
ncbi:MAG: PDZ domain-containing protein [Myxococcota bacterium]